MRKPERPRYSSWTDKGECKSSEVLAAVADEIIPQLSEAAKAAMLELANGVPSCRNAITARAAFSVVSEMTKFCCISGFSRSGDNAYPFEPLGKAVRDQLLTENERAALAAAGQ